MEHNNKIAFFAGTFDPIHQGHITFLHKALQHVDHVYLMPEREPQHKDVKKPVALRLKKLEQDVESLELYGVSIFHSKFDNFTVASVLDELRSEFPHAEMHFMFGDDILDSMKNWIGIERLADEASLIIGTRHQCREEIIENIRAIDQRFFAHVVDVNIPISSTSIRQGEAV